MGRPPAPRRPLLDALRGQVVAPPPVWLMRQAGRYLPEYRALRARARDFLELCFDPDLAVELTLQPIRRYPLDGAILFSDILVIPHALGVRVRFVEGEGPRLDPVRSAEAIRGLRREAVRERLWPVFETVRRLREELPAGVALIGFSGMPWTLAAYLVEGAGTREFLEARRFARARPDLFEELIDLLTAAVSDHLAAQVEAGADALQLFDSWAGVLPEDEFERWVVAPARRILAELRRRHPDVPVIAFPRGAGTGYQRFAQAVPVAALALDTTVSLSWARRALAEGCGKVLQGNLDPVALAVGGAALAGQVRRILEAMRGLPFVFNLGHGVLPDTPPGHVAELLSHLQSMGRCAN